MDQIPRLAGVFSYLSFLTIGGGMAAFPEMKNLVVNVHQWLTDEQLVHVYSVGQMSPGPNMMMVAEVGYLVAGFLGALVAALAFFLPTGFLTFAVGRIWNRLAGWPWRDSIQKGLGPVAIGMAVAGLITFGKGAIHNWLTLAVALAVFAASLRTRINPALLIASGAIVGVAGLR
ncbi:MAG: chromate transporter [Candidatus Eremiobacteraeota bacterium]|nr:chromate transporter [Candidatus Eremiobacteraeota bacterium]MBV8285219.1 chromate transporter [Candidatus Eremiobacteraeota bacterium]MBV8433349.1 chromate transporter [Candidatus Eremiobacteraeota bacterium]